MVKINATVFYSYQVCPREAWFYYHQMSSNPDNPYIQIGRLIHETSYKRDKKEVLVDNLLKIDIVRDELVAEVKKSSRHKKAAYMQLAYYLYYLKHEKGITTKGLLLFPKERKREEVVLTEELEKEVEKLLQDIEEIVQRDVPPPPRKTRYCKKCSFYEFCYADDGEQT